MTGIDRPIFLVGCGRSGTTVIYEVLCEHPALAWFSNYTQRIPELPQLAALSRLRRLGRPAKGSVGIHWRPHPTEGHRAWDWCTGELPGGANRPLGRSDLTERAAHRARSLVRAHVRWQGASRFINKNTRNARRVGYLHAAFPDAIFVHVVRDPCAVARSLTRVAFWPSLPIWWADDVTPAELVRSGWSQLQVAAEFWAREVRQVLTDAAELPPGQLVELRYEDFLANPKAATATLLDRVGLERSVAVETALDDRIRPPSTPSEPLPAPELERIWQAVGTEAAAFGYEPPREGGPVGGS